MECSHTEFCLRSDSTSLLQRHLNSRAGASGAWEGATSRNAAGEEHIVVYICLTGLACLALVALANYWAREREADTGGAKEESLKLHAGVGEAPEGSGELAVNTSLEEVELIRSPLLLCFFECLVQRPGRSSCGLALLLLGSCCAASQYALLQNRPLDLEPYSTRLKETHQKLQGIRESSLNTTHASILVWSAKGHGKNLPQLKIQAQSLLVELQERSAGGCDALRWDASSPSRTKKGVTASVLDVQFAGTIEIGQQSDCLSSIRRELAQLSSDIGDSMHVALSSQNAVVEASVDQSVTEASHHLFMSAPIMAALLMLGVGKAQRALSPFLCLFASLASMRASMVLIKWSWFNFNFVGPDTAITFVLLALCFDYALFFWSRFSEERRRHWQPDAYLHAVMRTLQTSGYVILLSMSVLLVTFFIASFYPDENTTGYLGRFMKLMSGTFFAAFYSLAIPSILVVLFPSIFDEAVSAAGLPEPSPEPLPEPMPESQLPWPRMIQFVSKHVTRSPCVFAAPFLLLVLFSPLLVTLQSVELSYDTFESYSSEKVSEFAAWKLHEDLFDLKASPAPLLLEALPVGEEKGEDLEIGKTLEFGKLVCRLAETIVRRTRGSSYEMTNLDIESIWWHGGRCLQQPIISKHSISQNGQAQIMMLHLGASETGSESQAMTEEFWTNIEPEVDTWTFEANGRQYRFRATLDSHLAEEILLERKYRERFPSILLFTVFSVSCLVGYAFSSLFVAVKLLFTVLLPILAEYGLMIGICQHGWLQGLGFKTSSGISWTMLYTTAGFLFALAIDYDLFLFARVYERRLEGYDNRSAVRMALEETSLPITLAGSMMVVAFFFVFLSSLPMVAQLGCLYCIGVAVDTYVPALDLMSCACGLHQQRYVFTSR